MKAREILIALYVKKNGDWDEMYQALQNKEEVDESYLEGVDTSKFVTIIDDEYKTELKSAFQPLFVYKKDEDIVQVFLQYYEREDAIKRYEDTLQHSYKQLGEDIKQMDYSKIEDYLCEIGECVEVIQKLKDGCNLIY